MSSYYIQFKLSGLKLYNPIKIPKAMDEITEYMCLFVLLPFVLLRPAFPGSVLAYCSYKFFKKEYPTSYFMCL